MNENSNKNPLNSNTPQEANKIFVSHTTPSQESSMSSSSAGNGSLGSSATDLSSQQDNSNNGSNNHFNKTTVQTFEDTPSLSPTKLSDSTSNGIMNSNVPGNQTPSEFTSGTLSDVRFNPSENNSSLPSNFSKDSEIMPIAGNTPLNGNNNPTKISSTSPNSSENSGEFSKIGKYTIVRELGKGGMGVVYEVKEPRSDRKLALKIMLSKWMEDAKLVKRFEKEIRAQANLTDDHIVPIHDIDEHEECLFFTMPLLEGENLATYLKKNAPLKTHDLLKISREIALGLQKAHENKLVHRDIKPGNLWLDYHNNQRIKILDFGLVKHYHHKDENPENNEEIENQTVAGTFVGTPSYMSPEQANGSEIDARSDLYSLGVVMYEMATGQVPFQNNKLMALLHSIGYDEAKPPRELNQEIPENLNELILQLLKKKPDDRPQSAQEVIQRLQQLEKPVESPSLNISSVSIVSPVSKQPNPESKQPNLKKSRSRVWIFTLIGCLLLGSLFLIFPLNHSPSTKSKELTEKSKELTELTGTIDVRFWKQNRNEPGKFTEYALNHPLLLPLHNTDRFHISIKTNRPAYAYLFWVGSDSQVTPVYPWEFGKWDSRDFSKEKKIEQLEYPEDIASVDELQGDDSGMETILLILRDEPIPQDEPVANWFKTLPKQDKITKDSYPQRFVNFQPLSTNGETKRSAGGKTIKIMDPIDELQSKLKEVLAKKNIYCTTFSFPRENKN